MLLAAPHFVLFAEVGLRELADDEQPVGIADSVQSADGSGVDSAPSRPRSPGGLAGRTITVVVRPFGYNKSR